jgi:hypothetical protein
MRESLETLGKKPKRPRRKRRTMSRMERRMMYSTAVWPRLGEKEGPKRENRLEGETGSDSMGL